MHSSNIILSLNNLVKTFPNVTALNDVSLDIYSGEVLALIGENGAGKSTMLKILTGDYQPDGGIITIDGQTVRFPTPRDARQYGIRVIYQEPEIVSTVSVAENIFLGNLPRSRGIWIDWNELYRKADEHIERYGFQNEVRARDFAEDLSAAQRQIVEILRALNEGVRVLALDEPTSSLTDNEAERLFHTVRRLREMGVALIYVSHRLNEITALSDRVAVLRDGEMVAVKSISETDKKDMMQLMVGRPLNQFFEKAHQTYNDVILHVKNLTTKDVHNINFEVHRGEVVGFTGLIGAGRTEVAEALFGITKIQRGEIWIDSEQVVINKPRDAMRAGIAYTPEERKAQALFLELNVRENASIATLHRITKMRFVNRKKELNTVSALIDRMRVKTPSLDQEIKKLSGGNQQKVVLARWLARSPRILILDEPTRGIDVGAKAEIYALINQLAQEGVAIIFISSELPEVIGISDRIIVMEDGTITGELDGNEATEEAILSLAMTQKAMQSEQST